MLPPNQRLIEQSNFAYSPLRKAFEKQTNKKIGYQEEKQKQLKIKNNQTIKNS